MVGHVKLSTTCAFPIFQKAKAFFFNYFFFKLNYLCELLFSNALWIINTRSIFSLVPLKIFWNFWNSSRKKSTQKQAFSGVYKIDILKKFANFTKKFQCWSHFLKKSPEIKRLQHRCFPINVAKLLRAPFLQSTSGEVGVSLLKCFTFRSSANSHLIVRRLNTQKCFCRFVGEIIRYERWFVK